jgi:hypothetical protein
MSVLEAAANARFLSFAVATVRYASRTSAR